MSAADISRAVLECVGGRDNVLSNSLCMTRLRLRLVDPNEIDRQTLEEVDGVLGLAEHGSDGLEVVFGPLVVNDVYDSFVHLTGLTPNAEVVEGSSLLSTNLHVHISLPHIKQTGNLAITLADPEPPSPTDTDAEDDLAGLDRLFQQDALEEATATHPASDATCCDLDVDEAQLSHDTSAAHTSVTPKVFTGLHLLVINGPNINMVGIREPNVYGRQTYDDILILCKETARMVGFAECSCFQSNHEGDIVDRIQEAYQVFDGIVINPGAYTHTSIAILDALKAVQIPAIEVHISDVSAREDFRQVSFVRLACFKTVAGLGIDGYRKAIEDMAAYLNAHCEQQDTSTQ